MLGMASIVGRRKFECRLLVRASLSITVFAAVAKVAIAAIDDRRMVVLGSTSLRGRHGEEWEVYTLRSKSCASPSLSTGADSPKITSSWVARLPQLSLGPSDACTHLPLSSLRLSYSTLRQESKPTT